jgi:hypothetical protein
LFFGIALPHRDDASRVAALRPNHHHHAPIEMSDRQHADFAVVFATILAVQRTASEDMTRVLEVDPTLAQRLSRLARSNVILIANYRTPRKGKPQGRRNLCALCARVGRFRWSLRQVHRTATKYPERRLSAWITSLRAQ